MKKVVINKCYGGFSLSDKGMLRLAELMGFQAVKSSGHFGNSYSWIHPIYSGNINDIPTGDQEELIYVRDIPRDDENLVKVVEELGNEANGFCAELRIVEIPDDVNFEVEEYDGMEWIAETHRTWH